ncbi:MAG: metallo-mystery pair system four-Cys motif protein [Gammaproteobacteria bacterium]|nr:metallo-mystery pair system four-Cys motif protein [Gammaproteobacteria bacterium]
MNRKYPLSAGVFRDAKRIALILIYMCLLGCDGFSSQAVAIRFAAPAVICGMGDNSVQQSKRVTDLRFYVSDVALVAEDGKKTAVRLEQESPWQYRDTALISLNCDQQGNTAENAVIAGSVPAGNYTGAYFSIGVPFDLNHANPLTAPEPLNISSLFWTWQLGYKFLRLDIDDGASSANSWSLHLGSSGCRSPAPVRPPVEACARPNILQVDIAEYDLEQDTILVDIDALLNDVDIFAANHCMGSFHKDGICEEILSRLGLNAANGGCVDDCRGQILFRKQAL